MTIYDQHDQKEQWVVLLQQQFPLNFITSSLRDRSAVAITINGDSNFFNQGPSPLFINILTVL